MASRVIVKINAAKEDQLLRDRTMKLTAGVHAAEGRVKHEEAEDEDGLPKKVIDIATENEFGLGVPERSFIRGWFDEHAQEIVQVAVRELQKGTKETWTRGGASAAPAAIEKALERTALVAEASIRRRIINGIKPENAPATVERKGSATPLVDTGQLLGSIRARATVKSEKKRKRK